MGVVAKKSSVLVLGHFTSLILSTATLNFNYKNVFQALYSITRFLRQTHDAWFSAGRFLLCRGSRWEKNKGSGKCAVNDGKREKALFLSIVAPYDTKRPLRRREYWALVKLNFSKDVRGINPLFDKIKSHGKRVILLFFFCFIFFSPLEADDNFSSLFRSISRLFWTLCNSNRRWFAIIQAYTSKWICGVLSRSVITLGLYSSGFASRSPTWNHHNQFPQWTTSSKRWVFFCGRITMQKSLLRPSRSSCWLTRAAVW